MRNASLILLALLLLACDNPFASRTAEPPSVRRGTWEDPSFYDAVLRNLESSYNEQIIDNFTDSISDSFRFIPDPEDEAQYPGIFDQWGFEQERDVTRSIFSSGQGSFIDLTLVDTTMEVTFYPTGDTVRAEVIYDLSVDQDTVSAPGHLVGRATFFVSEEAGSVWKIYRWEDSKADFPDSSSWGELRAVFSGG
ncbi:hypothetical protein ACFL0G_03990 [Candidatus Zixiibacteriota bacterium]